MKVKQYIKEIGMIAAIISDHITNELYDLHQKKGEGYISTVETISNWSLEFLEAHKRTNWEEVLDNTLKPKSKKWGSNSIICWDDAVIDFAYYKLENFDK